MKIQTKNVSQLTGRKSHKLGNNKSGGIKEAVWPPHLEAALLEGLRRYRGISKSGAPLRRFPKRNVRIAEYIYATTQQARSAKQVGSRLQQIAETSEDAEIIHLITNRELHSQPHADDEQLAGYVTASDIGTLEATGAVDEISLSAKLVDIASKGCTFALDAFIQNPGMHLMLSINQANGSSASDDLYSGSKLIPSSHLLDEVPILSIISSLLTPDARYACHFGLFLDNMSSLYATEMTFPVIQLDCPAGPYLVTPLLPTHWATLIQRASIERYTIVVDVFELPTIQTLDLELKFSVDINMKLSS